MVTPNPSPVVATQPAPMPLGADEDSRIVGALGQIQSLLVPGETIEAYGGRKAPLAWAVIALTNDWADHYSGAAMYLRLNGLLPPTAKPMSLVFPKRNTGVAVSVPFSAAATAWAGIPRSVVPFGNTGAASSSLIVPMPCAVQPQYCWEVL